MSSWRVISETDSLNGVTVGASGAIGHQYYYIRMLILIKTSRETPGLSRGKDSDSIVDGRLVRLEPVEI